MRTTALLVPWCVLACGRTPYEPEDLPRLSEGRFSPGLPEHLGPVVHLCGEVNDRCARLRLAIRAHTIVGTGELGDDPCEAPASGGAALTSFEGQVDPGQTDRLYVLATATFSDGTAIEIDTVATPGECP